MKAANQVVLFGKRLFSIRYVYSGSDFKPCSHEGSDPQKWYKNNSQRVSIHVPIMGATTEIAQICPLVRVSIHAPTKGALMSPTLRISCSFNPRSHEGSDVGYRLQSCNRQCFNPRSHEGSDFNSALRGMRHGGFNPRSHEGSDWYNKSKQRQRVRFNPRSHEGSDHITYLIMQKVRGFNPRSHEGSD